MDCTVQGLKNKNTCSRKLQLSIYKYTMQLHQNIVVNWPYINIAIFTALDMSHTSAMIIIKTYFYHSEQRNVKKIALEQNEEQIFLCWKTYLFSTRNWSQWLSWVTITSPHVWQTSKLLPIIINFTKDKLCMCGSQIFKINLKKISILTQTLIFQSQTFKILCPCFAY
jgi:hypothetical protein